MATWVGTTPENRDGSNYPAMLLSSIKLLAVSCHKAKVGPEPPRYSDLRFVVNNKIHIDDNFPAYREINREWRLFN